MLEFSFRFTLADEISTDDALIAGLPHDLRAIAEQIAASWPGTTLNPSLGTDGRLARPARLDVHLAHGGRATLEVRQAFSGAERAAIDPALGAAPTGRRASPRGRISAQDLDDALAAIVSPERLDALAHDVPFRAALDRATQALSVVDPTRARNAMRLMRSFAGPFVDLVAKDRSGYWVRLADAPAVDPYYVCAEFQQNGARSRVPLLLHHFRRRPRADARSRSHPKSCRS